MKKNKKILVLGIVLTTLLGICFVILINYKPQTPIEKSSNFDLEKSLVKKSIDEVDGLIELSDKEKAIVVQIKNKEELVKLDAMFNRVYQNDIVIFLPNQTIIYDVSTKTIRDISSESFYEEVTR